MKDRNGEFNGGFPLIKESNTAWAFSILALLSLSVSLFVDHVISGVQLQHILSSMVFVVFLKVFKLLI